MAKHGPPKKPRPKPKMFIILLIPFIFGCSKPISIEQCAAIFAEASDLTLAIADVATTDEEKLVYVARAAAITDLAGAFGCQIVIPMLDE